MSSPPADGASAGHRWRKVPVCPNSFICIKVWKRFEEQISVCGLFPVGCLSNLTPCLHGLQLRRGLAHMPTAMFLWKLFSSKAQNRSKHSAVGERPIYSSSCQLLVTDSPAVRKVEVIWGNCSSCVFGLKELCLDSWSYWLPVNRAVARSDQICLLF